MTIVIVNHRTFGKKNFEKCNIFEELTIGLLALKQFGLDFYFPVNSKVHADFADSTPVYASFLNIRRPRKTTHFSSKKFLVWQSWSLAQREDRDSVGGWLAAEVWDGLARVQ